LKTGMYFGLEYVAFKVYNYRYRRCVRLERMTVMLENEVIVQEIDGILKNQIKSAEVVKVFVYRGEFFDGDPKIDVTVIYDSKNKKINPDETLGIISLVRKRLGDLNEFAFPSFHFILKSEAGKLIEAA
jgi:hypothetical protein